MHVILVLCLLSSDSIPTADYNTQDNLLDFQRFLSTLGISCAHSILSGAALGGGVGGLKSNEKPALSSQKTVNKQDEVIGTTGCAPLVMMAPLIGLLLTQLQAAPLNFHCSHFPSQCDTHSHCFHHWHPTHVLVLNVLLWTRYAVEHTTFPGWYICVNVQEVFLYYLLLMCFHKRQIAFNWEWTVCIYEQYIDTGWVGKKLATMLKGYSNVSCYSCLLLVRSSTSLDPVLVTPLLI